MLNRLFKAAWVAAVVFLFAGLAFAQTTNIEGDVKGEDGLGLKGALVKIDRQDIKGHYEVKTDKKGHYFHAGLPIGTYNISCWVDGKEVGVPIRGVRTTLSGIPMQSFDLQADKRKRDAMQKSAQTGQITKEQSREMSAEQKAAYEKAVKERSESMKKNKELNDTYTAGIQALDAGNASHDAAEKGKQFDAAVQALDKGSQLDDKQPAIWAHLAEAYVGLAGTKAGPDREAAYNKAFDAYQKALALKPDDAAMHNNYALALSQAKKFPEMQAELAKAAQLDPSNAGKYFYNLGAVLVNVGQNEAAGDAFKKAIEIDPNYADAQYQYGIFLVSKAKIQQDGKIDPVPGTKEAFEKYLQLKPDGPYAEPAKQMIASLTGAVAVEYKDPDAEKKAKAKKATKK